MPTGVILECNDDSINQQRLKYGGVEVKTSTPAVKKEAAKKQKEDV